MEERTQSQKEKDAEDLFSAFHNGLLCGRFWHMLLDLENKPEIEKRLLNWFRGEYGKDSASFTASNRALERIQKKVNLPMLHPKRGNKRYD